MSETVRLSDAQFGVLSQLIEFGPITAEEILLPPSMDGTRKVKIHSHILTQPTLAKLEASGLVEVSRSEQKRPQNAVGKAGYKRNSLVVKITGDGRLAFNSVVPSKSGGA